MIAALLVMALLFSFVVLFGAPYLPTTKKQSLAALELLDLKKGQVFYELGCGDGRVLKLAARQGMKCVGYELNPLLALIARLNTWRYRDEVKIICDNYWRANLSEADGVYVFLLKRYMTKLDKKIISDMQKPMKLASFAFEIPGKSPESKKNGVFLYKYNSRG